MHTYAPIAQQHKKTHLHFSLYPQAIDLSNFPPMFHMSEDNTNAFMRAMSFSKTEDCESASPFEEDMWEERAIFTQLRERMDEAKQLVRTQSETNTMTAITPPAFMVFQGGLNVDLPPVPPKLSNTRDSSNVLTSPPSVPEDLFSLDFHTASTPPALATSRPSRPPRLGLPPMDLPGKRPSLQRSSAMVKLPKLDHHSFPSNTSEHAFVRGLLQKHEPMNEHELHELACQYLNRDLAHDEEHLGEFFHASREHVLDILHHEWPCNIPPPHPAADPDWYSEGEAKGFLKNIMSMLKSAEKLCTEQKFLLIALMERPEVEKAWSKRRISSN